MSGDFPLVAPITGVAPDVWRQFISTVDSCFCDPDADPTAEDVGLFVALFRRLRKAGVEFCAEFIAWVEAIATALRGTDADSDNDVDLADEPAPKFIDADAITTDLIDRRDRAAERGW